MSIPDLKFATACMQRRIFRSRSSSPISFRISISRCWRTCALCRSSICRAYLLVAVRCRRQIALSSTSKTIQTTTSTISPGFLRTLAIPLLQGRDFDASDKANSQRVVLINQVLANKLWPNGRAVGREIELGCSARLTATVVGVVANSKTVSLTQAAAPHVYRTFAQNATGLANIVVEASGAPPAMAEQLRHMLLNEGHGMRVYAVNKLSEHVERSYWQLRWEAWLLGAFGATALLLAALGLYGVVSYGTALRTKEFGVRLALGARGSDVLQLVLKEGLVLGAIGAVVGTIAALALSSVSAQLSASGEDICGFCVRGCRALWLVVVAGAYYAPARRSSHIEPSITLRYD